MGPCDGWLREPGAWGRAGTKRTVTRMSNANMVLERSCDRARRIDEPAWANPNSPDADEAVGMASAWNSMIALRKAGPMLSCCPFGGRPLVLFLCLGALLACVGCGEKRAEVGGKVTV